MTFATATGQVAWAEANQRQLVQALDAIAGILERHAAGSAEAPPSREGPPLARRTLAAVDPADPPVLARLVGSFGLSTFERDLLLLCAGMELEARFATLCAAAQGDPERPYPTFSLALAALAKAHWSALTPDAPLRRWRLIEVGPGPGLVTSPLQIDERILHHLVGLDHVDERLAGLIEELPPPATLAPSHHTLAERMAAHWEDMQGRGRLPVLQVCGADRADRRAVAAAACETVGLRLLVLAPLAMPTGPTDLETTIRLCEREATLSGATLFLECDDLDPTDALREQALDRLIERLDGRLVVAGRQPRRPRQRPMIQIDVPPPTIGERAGLWRQLLGMAALGLDGQIDQLAAQFSLSLPAIQSACAARVAPDAPTEARGQALWDACRVQARPLLDDLAQRVETAATWDDLVLPEPVCRLLREIAMQVRQRATVYERWGFAARSARGLGISALFTGASGTGKTLAAEVLANELRLDLFRIDLSAVVSKYIGETEKNLRRVFDAAEGGGAILLFDEADALFGKRSEVKDSHDRFANIEIGYLLQRMEAYRGLAVLTTNMKEALDSAFQRRIRFVVQFPFPDAAQRAEIWRRVFPATTPTEALDVGTLARLNVAGGSIRNIALYAAFLAADEGAAVQMRHLMRAARVEYAKLERPLTETETRGWLP